ncbi:MHYT domain-containing protein [Labrenzia sp. PHM005]|uniref:MHYT domain-containing protein n=1 Tax=Labrenzia sp. PHM005 TaxID=2590016 RepID=UPI00113FF7B6|nr:MHYT domain-containing protein [Labrenzia sp. PHM005]QDG75972.1 carbon monoxide dehydrogenase [Labrenzia sp. PHM005]
MTVTHEPWLVALSLVMAFQGSFVGLSLAVQVGSAQDPRRRHLLAGAALTLALAIWSMHFVGILAAKFQVTIDYLVLPTLLSFLVCVLVVGIAVFAASNKRLTPLRLGLSAFVMGAGICTMHYLGMYALHTSLHMAHDPAYVLASFLIAFNAAGLALWLLFSAGRRPPIVVSAVVMGLAISAMHYTAMTGLTFDPAQSAASLTAPSLGPGALAILVSCVAFLVSALFLLALVPAQSGDKSGEAEAGTAFSAPTANISAEVAPDEATSHSIEQKTGLQPKPASGLQAAAKAVRKSASAIRKPIPIEFDGRKTQIDPAEIVAIHADAHYTRLHDSRREYFCPLSISEAEQQLDPKIFNRVHRSHIVNLTKVINFKRAGDGGVLHLAGDDGQTVPVSRSRWGHVKSKLTSLEQPSGDPSTAAAQ